jgi:hypothetical protein
MQTCADKSVFVFVCVGIVVIDDIMTHVPLVYVWSIAGCDLHEVEYLGIVRW